MRPDRSRGLAPLVLLFLGALLFATPLAAADPVSATMRDDPFRPMDDVWPTPNDIRTASGAPGAHYWQQKVDYRMRVRLDEPSRTLEGEAQIAYHNNSPDTLRYLWLLLDQNRFRPEALREQTRTVDPDAPLSAADSSPRTTSADLARRIYR